MKRTCKSILSFCLALLLVFNLCDTTVLAMENGDAPFPNTNSNLSEAESENSVSELEASDGEPVSNWNELSAAVSNPNISTITVKCDIDLEDALTIDRDIRIVSNSTTETYKLNAMSEKRHIVFPENDEIEIHLEFSNIELDCTKNDTGGLKRQGNGPVSIDNLVLRGFKLFVSGENTNERELHQWGIDIPNLILSNSSVIDCRSDGMKLSKGQITNCIFEQDRNLIYGYYTGIRAGAVNITNCQVSNFSLAGIEANGSLTSPTEIADTEIRKCRSGVDLSVDYNHSELYEPRYCANINNCNIHDCGNGVYLNVTYGASSSMFNYTTANITDSCFCDCGNAVNSTGGTIYLANTELSGGEYGIKKSYCILYVQGGKIYNNSEAGVYSYAHGITSLSNCELYENGQSPKYYGGAIHVSARNGYETVLQECNIHNNWAYSGGAIYANASPLTVENCTIYENTANQFGGGIYAEKYDVTITNTDIYGNNAGEYGGGVYLGSAVVYGNGNIPAAAEFTNCDFSNNEALKGGGIYSAEFSNDFVNTTIQGNQASYYGGGIYCEDLNVLSTDAQTLFAANGAGQIFCASSDIITQYPNILFAGTSHGSHPLNNLDINYTTEADEKRVLRGVELLPDENVLYETAVEDLPLPDTISVTLDNNQKMEVDIQWNTSTYNSTDAGKAQIIEGILNLPTNVVNPYEYVAKKQITVHYPHIISCAALAPITVKYGTDLGEVYNTIKNTYPTVKAELVDGCFVDAEIWWEYGSEGIYYDGYTSGIYQIVGGLLENSSGEYSNAINCTVNVDVVVDSKPPEVTSVADLDDYSVILDTDAEELETLLNKFRPTVEVEFDRDESNDPNRPDKFPIKWDVADPNKSNYNGSVPNEYTIVGTLDFGDRTYLNPRNIQPVIAVRVLNKSTYTITQVEPTFLETRKYFYLDTKMNEEGYENYDLEETPKTVRVTLENEDTREIPVEWNDAGFDPTAASDDMDSNKSQIVPGRLILPEGSDVDNYQNLSSELHITVIPMTDYLVFETQPEEINIEVYAGTTFEELNLQLKNEGKSYLTVGLDDGGWGSYTRCEFEVNESENPEWNTLKDAFGNEEPYQLIASLPEDMMLLCDNPIVNVTVLEPLRVDAVVSPTIEAYQSVEFENLPNLPTQVQAVLEDGQSVSVDVEWTPTAYNKDLVGAHIVLGHLINLPRIIKAPESGAITASMAVNVIPVDYDIVGVIEKNPYQADAGLSLEEITEIASPKAIYEIASTTEGVDFTTQYEVSISLEQGKNPGYDPEYAGSYTIKGTVLVPDNISCPSEQGFEEISLTTNPVRILSVETPSILTKEGTEFDDLEKPQAVIGTLSCLDPEGNCKKVSLDVDWSSTGYTPFPESLTDNNTITMQVMGQIVNCPQYIISSGIEPTLYITTAREFSVTDIAPIQFSGSENMKVNLGSSLDDIYNQLDTHNVEITLQSTKGDTSTVDVTFSLRPEDNPEYDPFTVGTYMLAAHVDLSENIINPDNLKSELPVKTMKYTVSNAQIVSLSEIPVGTQFEDLPLPNVAAALKDDNTQEDISVTWKKGKYNPDSLKAQVIQGAFGELPIYLENPKNRQPRAIVTLVDKEAEILSLTEIGVPLMERSVYSDFEEIERLGYEEHCFVASLRYPNGNVVEVAISAYKEIV